MFFIPAFQVLQFFNKTDFGWYNQITSPDRALISLANDSTGASYVVSEASDSSSLTYLTKINADGTVAWMRSFTSGANNFGLQSVLLNGGTYIACGYNSGPSQTEGVIHFNSSGGTEAQRSFSGSHSLRATDANDNMMFIRASNGAIIKYDINYNPQWGRTAANGGFNFTPQRLSMDSTNVYAGGELFNGSYTEGRIYKIAHATPSITWQRKITYSTNFINVNLVKNDSSGNIYVRAYSSGTGRLLKIDTNGTLSHQAINAGDSFVDVAIDPSGNIYTLNLITVDPNTTPYLVVDKFNSSGTAQWSRKILAYDWASWGTIPFAGAYFFNSQVKISAFADNYIVLWGNYVLSLPSNGRLLGRYGNIEYTELSLPAAQSSIFSLSSVTDTFSSTTNSLSSSSFTTGTVTPTATRTRI